jgi:hypothetical protein
MVMNRDKTFLSASLALAGLTAIFLIAASLTGDAYRINSILIILSGMTTMGSFTSFQRFIEGGKTYASNLPVKFNEEFLSTSIAQAFKQLTEGRVLPEKRQLPSWELTSDHLIGKDNALALAKLRIDLESELRHIAFNVEVNLPERPINALEIARKLIGERILPAEMLEPLKDVLAVCNRGVHGEEIPDALASSVVRIGNELLEQLRIVKYS